VARQASQPDPKAIGDFGRRGLGQALAYGLSRNQQAGTAIGPKRARLAQQASTTGGCWQAGVWLESQLCWWAGAFHGWCG